MSEVLALPILHSAVVARFAADAAAQVPPATPPPQPFGWREPAKRSGTMRIVWVPGDDESGELGTLASARQPGRNPRPLATLHELFTVYIEAVDPSGYEDEKKQYAAARWLFDAWWRAVHLAAYGTVELRSAAWVTTAKERRYGATLRVLCAIQAMIPDSPLELAPADTKASIATSELDATETTIAAAPVSVATTGPITLSGEQTIDGEKVWAGDRVLVKDQAAAQANGIYVAAAGAWTRAADADDSSEVVPGLLVYVAAGATNGPAQWVLTTPAPIVLGTTPLAFERVQGE